MKIGILGTRGIPARYGGFETFAEELATRLAVRGKQVTVYCESDHSGTNEYRGVHLQYLSAPRLGPFTTILFDLKCLWHARKTFDVVYMLGYGAAAFCFIPRMAGTKVLINMDGVEWARAKWNAFGKLYFKLMEAVAMHTPTQIVADAESIRRHLLERHRKVPACTVIPYGAAMVESVPDPTPLAHWGLKPNEYYLILCRLEPENHVEEIVQGFIRSKTKRKLVIFGGLDSGTAYVERLRKADDPRVIFAGTEYSPEKVQALRSHCRAYFHGHSVGGTNPSLLESMGCGALTVAHENPFNREVLAEAGLFFSTPQQLAGLIDRIDANEIRDEQQLRTWAREIVKVRYSWELVTDRYEELFTAVCPVEDETAAEMAEEQRR
jgi:glycosyltransferase involved in cell wall biosynthesis